MADFGTSTVKIWQIADTENRGLLTPAGFSVALRLIGHCQTGKAPSLELAKKGIGQWLQIKRNQ